METSFLSSPWSPVFHLNSENKVGVKTKSHCVSLLLFVHVKMPLSKQTFGTVPPLVGCAGRPATRRGGVRPTSATLEGVGPDGESRCRERINANASDGTERLQYQYLSSGDFWFHCVTLGRTAVLFLANFQNLVAARCSAAQGPRDPRGLVS